MPIDVQASQISQHQGQHREGSRKASGETQGCVIESARPQRNSCTTLRPDTPIAFPLRSNIRGINAATFQDVTDIADLRQIQGLFKALHFSAVRKDIV